MIVPSKPERKTLQKIAGELLVECGVGMREDEPAWIQMKPGPRDEADHTGPNLIGAPQQMILRGMAKFHRLPNPLGFQHLHCWLLLAMLMLLDET